MARIRSFVRARRAPRLTAVAALVAAGALTIALGASDAHAAAALSATVEPKVADAGEPVRLTLRFDGDAPAGRPDLSPLDADFEIVGSQQSQRVSIVNGRVEQTRELEILLLPKRGGTIEIPALHAGDLASEPLRLTVRDAGDATSDPQAASSDHDAQADDARAAAARNATGRSSTTAAGLAPNSAVARALASGEAPPDLFVDATVDQTKPFVQGEVRYTVRVFDGVGIRQGALTEPEASGARIEPRGETRTSEQVVAGRRYVVHERDFAVFPQSSGAVTIPPVILQARIPDEDGARRSPFGGSAFDDMFGDDLFAEMFARMRAGGFGGSLLDRMMDPGREVRVRSNPVTLDVQGRPADAGDGWFLPATSVTLEQSWSPAQPTFRVGETVRRTITLRAEGAAPAQLPELSFGDVAGVKQYPATPERRALDGATSGAQLVQSIDLLPTAEGTVTLPAIEVSWWDVASEQARTATLPAETIEVLAAPGATQQAANAPAPARAAGARPSATTATAPASNAGVTTDDTQATNAATDAATWNLAALRALVTAHPLASAATGAGVAALLALASLLALRARRKHAATVAATAATATSHTASRVPARALVDALHQACARNDARAVRDALLAWGRATWSDAPPTSATAVARKLGDADFLRAVKALDDSLYAPQSSPLDGAAFRCAFDVARRAGAPDASRSSSDVLPALYPDSHLA